MTSVRSHFGRDSPPFTLLAQNDLAFANADVGDDLICQERTHAQRLFLTVRKTALELEPHESVLAPSDGLRLQNLHLVFSLRRLGHGGDCGDSRVVGATGGNQLLSQTDDFRLH